MAYPPRSRKKGPTTQERFFSEKSPAGPRLAHGKASEKRVAGHLGLTETRASGAMAFDKGDSRGTLAVIGKVRMESKCTTANSLGLQKAWLDKILSEATARGESPMISLSFVDDNGMARDANSDWVAMPMWLLQQITGGYDV